MVMCEEPVEAVGMEAVGLEGPVKPAPEKKRKKTTVEEPTLSDIELRGQLIGRFLRRHGWSHQKFEDLSGVSAHTLHRVMYKGMAVGKATIDKLRITLARVLSEKDMAELFLLFGHGSVLMREGLRCNTVFEGVKEPELRAAMLALSRLNARKQIEMAQVIMGYVDEYKATKKRR